MKNLKMIRKDHSSLFRRVFIPMCLLVGLIACLIMGVTGYYDIFGQMNTNSRNLFDQQVANKTRNLENMMLTKWSNIEGDVSKIQEKANKLIEKQNISMEELSKSSSSSTMLLGELSDELIEMLRGRGTTGAFMFLSGGLLPEQEVVNTPGVYLIDNDPDGLYASTNDDLLVERCPTELIDQLNIPLNSSWKPLFEFHDDEVENNNQIINNFNSALTNQDFSVNDVASWLKPYQIYGSQRYSTSYILPLIYNNQIYGVVGIDISFSYLQKMLPYDELNENGNAAFMIAVKDNEQTYTPLYINGPAFNHDIEISKKFQTEGKKDLYINGEIYCSVQELNLYNSNTPYDNKQWVVMGAIHNDHLLSFANRLKSVVVILIGIVIGIGALLSFVLSRYITKPISSLASYIGKTSSAVSRVNLKRTHIIEIDQLIEAIERMGNDVIGSASRFTNIIQLANTNLAGFEIDYTNDELFVTDNFFDIFLLHDIDTKLMSIEEFVRTLNIFESSCIATKNINEYLYHIESKNGDTYLRLRYHKENEKYVGLVEEVTDMIKERQIIEHERDHDVLTGLMNRRAFQRKMKRLFSIDNHKLKVASLVMMDLDNLKEVNDEFGHDCGDVYIKAAGKIFRESTPNETIVSRTSGDEFYLFFYGYNSREEIEEKLEALKEALHYTLVKLPNNKDVNVCVSGGVAWYPSDSNRFEELQRFSDYAMYSVKRSLKGKIKSFSLVDYENNIFIVKKRAEYHRLIKNKEYTHYFQPIVDAHTGEIFAYESLLRSLNPSFKGPMEIISLAKLEGELDKIELLTWEGTLAAYYKFYQMGLVNKEARIFINSLSSQFIPDDKLYELEKRTPELMNKIVLEVTEEEENDENIFIDKVSRLERWHAQIALDDYGRGYNSERNLLIVNPNFVKIDIDIIRDIDKDADKQKLVENIVSYCHERNKKIIAEGVETETELQKVLYLGVDYIQGYFFAKGEEIPPNINETSKKILLEINDKIRYK